jgi:hypothetical protein
MALRRGDIPPPSFPHEPVHVESLGGEVVVYGLGLADKLRFSTWDGPRFAQLCEALAICVRDDEGAAIWTSEQWDAWGSLHVKEALDLFGVIERLSGMTEEQVSKN